MSDLADQLVAASTLMRRITAASPRDLLAAFQQVAKDHGRPFDTQDAEDAYVALNVAILHAYIRNSCSLTFDGRAWWVDLQGIQHEVPDGNVAIVHADVKNALAAVLGLEVDSDSDRDERLQAVADTLFNMGRVVPDGATFDISADLQVAQAPTCQVTLQMP